MLKEMFEKREWIERVMKDVQINEKEGNVLINN